MSLLAEARNCIACPLHENRNNVVFGEGPTDAEVMLVGEAPGALEDKTGRPFVGQSGTLLTQTLKAIGIPREEIYITNVVKCRPPNNRDPRFVEEQKICAKLFLFKQIYALKPKILVLMGRIAAQFFFGPEFSITRCRGMVKNCHLKDHNLEVFAIFHPAYVLRNPVTKGIFTKDLQQISAILEGKNNASNKES